jgi:hypothetical protein
MLSPAAPLLGGEAAVGVDLGLEAGQERRPGGGGRFPRVVAGMHRVSRQPGPQAPLGWGKALLTTRLRQGRRGTLFAQCEAGVRRCWWWRLRPVTVG